MLSRQFHRLYFEDFATVRYFDWSEVDSKFGKADNLIYEADNRLICRPTKFTYIPVAASFHLNYIRHNEHLTQISHVDELKLDTKCISNILNIIYQVKYNNGSNR